MEIINKLFRNRKYNRQIHFVSDGANWVLDEIGQSLYRSLRDRGFRLVKDESEINQGIIHYSTVYKLPEIIASRKKRVKYIVTFFHVSEDHHELLRLLVKNEHLIYKVHTSNEITKRVFIDFGLAPYKIVVIPIGLEVKPFMNQAISTKEAKEQLGIPLDKVVIGSFQKDGSGWGEGLDPKLIKGPDVFCDVLERLNSTYPIHVLLTGPSRGYVKKRLEKAKIPHTHRFLDDYLDIIPYYKALDLYLVTSRVEGGPRAPLECFASGVPVISTKVGQTPEVITHGENGYLTEVGDIEGIVTLASELIESNELKTKFISNGIKSIGQYDYNVLSEAYFQKLYNE